MYDIRPGAIINADCPMCGTEIEPYPIAVTAWIFGGRAQVLLGGVHRNE